MGSLCFLKDFIFISGGWHAWKYSAQAGQKKETDFQELDRVPGSCELLDLDAGNQT